MGHLFLDISKIEGLKIKKAALPKQNSFQNKNVRN